MVSERSSAWSAPKTTALELDEGLTPPLPRIVVAFGPDPTTVTKGCTISAAVPMSYTPGRIFSRQRFPAAGMPHHIGASFIAATGSVHSPGPITGAPLRNPRVTMAMFLKSPTPGPGGPVAPIGPGSPCGPVAPAGPTARSHAHPVDVFRSTSPALQTAGDRLLAVIEPAATESARVADVGEIAAQGVRGVVGVLGVGGVIGVARVVGVAGVVRVVRMVGIAGVVRIAGVVGVLRVHRVERVADAGEGQAGVHLRIGADGDAQEIGHVKGERWREGHQAAQLNR